MAQPIFSCEKRPSFPAKIYASSSKACRRVPFPGSPSSLAKPGVRHLCPCHASAHYSAAPVWSCVKMLFARQPGGPRSPVLAPGTVTLVSESCWRLVTCSSFGSSRAGLTGPRLCSGRGGTPGKCNSVMPRTTQRSLPVAGACGAGPPAVTGTGGHQVKHWLGHLSGLHGSLVAKREGKDTAQ